MEEFSKIERLITVRLIQEDAEAIYSLLESERDPIFSICIIPYYVLFVQSCEEYVKSDSFDGETAAKIKSIRNNIKAYADRFGKTTRRIESVDEKQDSIFRSQLRFDFMRSWNVHYNLGTFWSKGKEIIGNTQMLSDILGIEDTCAPGMGEMQKRFAEQVSSYIASIRSGLSESLSLPKVSRKQCSIEIPFYCDFNTNRKNNIIGKELPKEICLLFLHLLCSLNFVRYILFGMFMPGNAWVFRIEYITTYYAFYALNKLNSHLHNNPVNGMDIFALDDLLNNGKELFLSNFRNCMMHYDLEGRGVLTVDNLDKPLFGLIETCFPGQSYESYSLQLETYRNDLCSYLEQYFDFSKVELKDNM